eukprot:11447667-Alexandrium_andersonii.AAC.1
MHWPGILRESAWGEVLPSWAGVNVEIGGFERSFAGSFVASSRRVAVSRTAAAPPRGLSPLRIPSPKSCLGAR